MSTRIETRTAEVVVTPTLDTSAYASGDRLGSIQTLDNACAEIGRGSTLLTVTILDKSKTKQAMTLLFFNALPTVASADNAAISITDAEMEKCVGAVAVAAADYAETAGNAIATLRASQVGVLMHSRTALGKLYVVPVIGGAATYGASDLIFTYKFVQDA